MGRESKQEVNRGEVKRSHRDHQDTLLIGSTVTPLSAVTGTVPPAPALQQTAPAKSSPSLVLLATLGAPSSRRRPAHVKSSPRADSLPTTPRPASDWAVRCENDQQAGASASERLSVSLCVSRSSSSAAVRSSLHFFAFTSTFALVAGLAASGTRHQAPFLGAK